MTVIISSHSQCLNANLFLLFDQVIHKHRHIIYRLPHAILWALHAARGLAYLHELNIVPKVLNTSTALLLEGGRKLKLSCHAATVMATRRRVVFCDDNQEQNQVWMAPETIDGPNRGRQTKASNIYSWSMLLWETLARRLPFAERAGEKTLTMAQQLKMLIEHDHRPDIEQECPRPLRELIEACWQKAADMRPNIDEVVEIIDQAYCLLGQLPEDIFELAHHHLVS